MGKFEPSVLVIPSPLGSETRSVPVEIEYRQEDIVGEVVDCDGSSSR
jgi:hypothetical protein